MMLHLEAVDLEVVELEVIGEDLYKLVTYCIKFLSPIPYQVNSSGWLLELFTSSLLLLDNSKPTIIISAVKIIT